MWVRRAPGIFPAEELREPAVRFGEAILEASSELRVNRCIAANVPRSERFGRPWPRAEEVERLPVNAGDVGAEVLCSDGEQLLAREMLQPAIDLLRVHAPPDVGTMSVVVVLARSRGTALLLQGEEILCTGKPLRLDLDSLLE